jgi:hypothetical protein
MNKLYSKIYGCEVAAAVANSMGDVSEGTTYNPIGELRARLRLSRVYSWWDSSSDFLAGNTLFWLDYLTCVWYNINKC